MTELTLYSRAGCHLCELLLEDLLPRIRGRADVTVVDIDTDTDLVRAYGLRVPVLAAAGQVICEGRLDPSAVYAWLDSVRA